MVEAFLFAVSFLACAALGLAVFVAGLVMAAFDARFYGSLRHADMEIAATGKRIAGDVLLTSIGLAMLAGGTSGILAMMGVL